jgi:hypothetical protein
MKFIKFALLIISFHHLSGQIVVEESTMQSEYARKRLIDVIEENKAYTSSKFIFKIDENLPKEAYDLKVSKEVINITGGDGTGLIYGVLGLIEDIRNGIAPSKLNSRSEKANLPFRAIKYDLPWDTYRHSPALDHHLEICKDLRYWEKFLDMMVENRFNALSLWNLHPYNYMIRSKKYPEACSFDDNELKVWQDLFHGIFKMAQERGIDTYVVPFNIFVSPAFAKAHNIMLGNIEHNHISNTLPDTSSLVIEYTRESIAQMFQEYPELDGMAITHGEMMGGMSPKEREDWLHATIIEGMRMAGRKTKLVHRIPLSADKNSAGSTSREAELITRHIIEQEADLDFIEQPIWADMKFNWSHAHSTPKLVKVHGGKLFDGYFNPVPEKYKVTWTARNEDFFCLRWGVPDFVRAHITENTKAYMGGYFIGSETYIPAKDYFTKDFDLDKNYNWQYAFERQWLFYKIWGRLMYNPQTSDAIFQSEYIRRFGKNGKDLLEANALAGKTPLTLASSFDCTWDFTLYSEGFMARNPKSGNVEYISVDRQINQPPLDPDYISIKDYVKEIIDKSPIPKSKITPIIMADMLKGQCTKALALVDKIDVSKNKTLMQEVADIKIWANLGLYFSSKTQGALALQLYRKQGNKTNKEAAIQYLEKALNYWKEVVAISQPLYNEMPLVHFSEQKNMTKEAINQLRFHWSNLTADVANDIEIAKNAVVEK